MCDKRTGKVNTRDDITSIGFILEFNKAKAVHELDLVDFSMASKVIFNLLLGS
jgi:hypothetical protein